MTNFSGLEVSHYMKSKDQILQTLPTMLVWRVLPEHPADGIDVLAIFLNLDGTVRWRKSHWAKSAAIRQWDVPFYSWWTGKGKLIEGEPIAWAYIRINEFPTTEEKTT